MNTTNKSKQMWESLRDPDFRKQLIDEHINVGVAFQIRSLRGRQKITQTTLAELLGDNSKQPMISEWENPNYGSYTLGTLKDLAKAFDVGLLVRFVPFSKLVDWTVDLTSDVIAPPNFGEEEERYHVAASDLEASNLIRLMGDTGDMDAYSLNPLEDDKPASSTISHTVERKKEKELVKNVA